MKSVFKSVLVLALSTVSLQSIAAIKTMDEKPIMIKAILKIKGNFLSLGSQLFVNQKATVDNSNYRMVLTPQVREGKMIEVTADILERIDGGFRRIATTKIVTTPGVEATVNQSGKGGYQLSIEPNVD